MQNSINYALSTCFFVVWLSSQLDWLQGLTDDNKLLKYFVQHIIKLHGFPKSIVSNKVKVSISKLWQHLFKLKGKKLLL